MSIHAATMRLVAFLVLLVPMARAKTASDYRVDTLPGQPTNVNLTMHAGHIQVDAEANGNLFFWHIRNQNATSASFGPQQKRTVIWINGGPGCSSEDGALMEIGPFRTSSPDTLAYNNASWSRYANLLFVDQPIGTGFSYGDIDEYRHELDQVAADFAIFLRNFFDTFPEYADDELYFSGESYAGTYLPYIVSKVLDTTQYNVRGVLIGNGWIDPRSQYGAYLPFASRTGLVTGKKALDSVTAASVECSKKLQLNVSITVPECESILDVILDSTRQDLNGQAICTNMYDIRLKDEYPSCGGNWPDALPNVTHYLRRDDVVKALNVDPERRLGWTECSGAVGRAFEAKKSAPAINLFPGLLEKVPIWLFSGEQDLICNHVGTETLIENLKWGGDTGMRNVIGGKGPEEWTVNGASAGRMQSRDNLTYVLVHDASHMVPLDQPWAAFDMLNRHMGIDHLVDASIVQSSLGDEGSEDGQAGDGVDQDLEDKVPLQGDDNDDDDDDDDDDGTPDEDNNVEAPSGDEKDDEDQSHEDGGDEDENEDKEADGDKQEEGVDKPEEGDNQEEGDNEGEEKQDENDEEGGGFFYYLLFVVGIGALLYFVRHRRRFMGPSFQYQKVFSGSHGNSDDDSLFSELDDMTPTGRRMRHEV